MAESLLARIDTIVSCISSKSYFMISKNDVSQGTSADEIAENIDEVLQLLSDNLPDAEIYQRAFFNALDERLEEVSTN